MTRSNTFFSNVVTELIISFQSLLALDLKEFYHSPEMVFLFFVEVLILFLELPANSRTQLNEIVRLLCSNAVECEAFLLAFKELVDGRFSRIIGKPLLEGANKLVLV
jgi:hypothetical protein